MNAHDRTRETLTLRGGEILGLDQTSDEKWRIASLDVLEGRSAVGGTVTSSGGTNRTFLGGALSRKEVPPEWTEMQFDSADDAVAFVEGQLAQGSA